MYPYNGPQYMIYPCKKIQQDLQYWYHGQTYTKWRYLKDGNSDSVWSYYKALHNPPASEKIVDVIRYDGTGRPVQLWAYIKRYNRL